MAKKLVKVIIPNPPICIRMAIIVRPPEVNVVGISMGDSPVTQTELVEIKRESIQEIPFTLHLGSIKSPLPTKMIKIKLPARICDGFVFFPNIRTTP